MLDARFSVSRAALLGAGLVSGAPELLAEAFADRLHEPYRGPLSPVYGPIKEELPPGAAGATISGSGPTVLVWARARRRRSLRGGAHGEVSGGHGAEAVGGRRPGAGPL